MGHAAQKIVRVSFIDFSLISVPTLFGGKGDFLYLNMIIRKQK